MATCKMNVVDRNGRSAPECTNCGHRFDTDYAKNPYAEMCRIAKGEICLLPSLRSQVCWRQIEGVDFDKCDPYETDWIMRGLNT